MTSFLQDYSSALQRAYTLDARVNSDALAISSDYAGLVALSIRQLLGAIEITLSRNTDGSFDISDVLIFLKEISSDGNVNTVKSRAFCRRGHIESCQTLIMTLLGGCCVPRVPRPDVPQSRARNASS